MKNFSKWLENRNFIGSGSFGEEITNLRKKVNEKANQLGFKWDDSLGNITKYQNKWYAIDFGPHD